MTVPLIPQPYVVVTVIVYSTNPPSHAHSYVWLTTLVQGYLCRYSDSLFKGANGRFGSGGSGRATWSRCWWGMSELQGSLLSF